MKKALKKALHTVFRPLIAGYRSAYESYKYRRARRNPKWMAGKIFKKRFGYPIDWQNPRGFNEKMRWIQFHTDTQEWSHLADKYAVRRYIREKGYGHLLVELYGKWDKAADIDFDRLPDRFVLKTNHGYGEILLVRDRAQADRARIRAVMQHYLDTPFGILSAEPHYLRIKPCIIAEELLPEPRGISTSIVDYKFYCFHGVPRICGVFYDRDMDTHQSTCTYYDADWQRRDEYLREDLRGRAKDMPRPRSLEQMLQACHDLAAQFPFVRMDFYEIEGRPCFGEFTFTPAALTGGSLHHHILMEWGKLIDLNEFRTFAK